MKETSSMKKLSVTLVLIGLVIFFISCTAISINATEIKGNKIEQIKDINSISGIVYFGRDTCPLCDKFSKNLEYVKDNYSFDYYYFDTDQFRENKKFDEILEKYTIDSVPTLMYLEEGKIIDKMFYKTGLTDGEQQELVSSFYEKTQSFLIAESLFEWVYKGGILTSLIIFLLVVYKRFRKEKFSVITALCLLSLLSVNCVVLISIYFKWSVYVDVINSAGNAWAMAAIIGHMIILLCVTILTISSIQYKKERRKGIYENSKKEKI